MAVSRDDVDTVLLFIAAAFSIAAFVIVLVERKKYTKHRKGLSKKFDAFLNLGSAMLKNMDGALRLIAEVGGESLMEELKGIKTDLENNPQHVFNKVKGLTGRMKADQNKQTEAVYETLDKALNMDLAGMVEGKYGMTGKAIAEAFLDDPTSGPIVQDFLISRRLNFQDQPNGGAQPAPSNEPEILWS